MSYEQELGFICSLNINEYKKAESIYKLMLDHKITQSDVTEFLFKNNLKSVAEAFFTFEEVGIVKRKINAVSGSDWTEEHIKYFNVIFEDVIKSDEICQIVDISKKANKFIEDNKDLNDLSFAGRKGKNLAKAARTDFQRKVMFVLLNPSKESCVDVMMQTFLENILDERFLVEQRYKMQLTISNIKKEATADVVAILFPQFYIGVIVVEDKPENTSETEYQHLNTEAQIVSEGIAVAQQEQWPSNTAVYMLRVMKTNVSIYKANFDKEFINSVKNGTRRIQPFVIKRFAPTPSIAIGRSRPGFDIVDPSDREMLVKIIYSISKYIVDLIPDTE